ncbi:MAG: glycosyltransferase [Candidatus Gottesmanbacteria bacterium GW2011_GWA2_43_14]|uniref:Glycosyltransferase n=1 Tax=Candidatus Gottesmanbacteria bacterium GW2011_GWA2_43_14 TaxID=1618443 RepID=A0A0G1DM80_9BACT|nr:MAG: glycosyltransferase [Candidatus Gottesmanbacteria bacterium GW2011_GWA2_43_14]
MHRAAVVIIHYRGKQSTFDCLNSLFKMEKKSEFSVYLVNNGTDDMSSVVWKYPSSTLILPGKNTGFAEGCNLGIKKALNDHFDRIVLINSDTLTGTNLISRLVGFSRRHKNAGLVSPKIYFAKGFEYRTQKYSKKDQGKVIWYAGGILNWSYVQASHRGVDEVDRGQFDKSEETDFATGCCMLITAEAIKKAGNFDKRFFLYYEDVDLSLRVKSKGLKIYYCPEAVVWHKNALSSEGPGSKLHLYFQTRNRLYIGYRYAPLRTKKSLFFDSLHLAGHGGIMRRAVLDYYFGRMGKGIL